MTPLPTPAFVLKYARDIQADEYASFDGPLGGHQGSRRPAFLPTSVVGCHASVGAFRPGRAYVEFYVPNNDRDDWLFGDGGFAKLYGDRLAESSLLECTVTTRWIFIWMLSQADAEGRFKCSSIEALARQSRTKASEARRAVTTLEQPDASSQTPDFEGRRIEKIHGGWRILNYQKYREFQTKRQRGDAERAKAYRNRKRDASRDVTVTPCDVRTKHQTPNVKHQTSESASKNVSSFSKSQSDEGVGSEPTDPEEITQDICLEANHWLGMKMRPSEPLKQVIANLLLAGSPRGGAMNGAGIEAEDILDAVRGYIVREKTDQYHEKRRREKSPLTLMWVFKSTDRLAEYGEFGREHFESWSQAEQERRDRRAQRDAR